MKVICNKCRCSRDVNKTEYDSFYWQCDGCGSRHFQKGIEQVKEIKINPISIDFVLTNEVE